MDYKLQSVNKIGNSVGEIHLGNMEQNTVVCMRCHVGRVPLFKTLWTVGSQAPLSMGFSR